MKILIKCQQIEVEAELNDSNTARAIWQALPITGKVNLWGEEIYFPIPLHVDLENGKEVVEKGDLGFWPDGDAFCIFFGATPISKKGEIRPASAVNIFGRIVGDAEIFKKVRPGAKITIHKASC